jgi:hypothetical protein
MDATSFRSALRIEKMTVFLVLPLVFMLTISIPNSLTYQILGQSSTQSDAQSFANSFESVVDETRLLDHDYHVQIGKWQRGEHSNETMASITDTYLPRYQELINKTRDLQAPTEYENATNLYAKSIESELNSYIHFRNYLLTGNKTESESSDQSLDDASRYETESFRAFYSVPGTSNR